MDYENCSWCSPSPVSDCHSKCKCVCHYEEAWGNERDNRESMMLFWDGWAE